MPPLAGRWTCAPYDFTAAARLSRELDVSPTTAAILVRRGHATPAAARRFLAAEERHDPFAFSGMRATCERILGHVERGSRIVVHGDYDVDGVCATAIVVRTLRGLGADPRWHLPSRFDDGYGLSVATVDRLADGGVRLLITGDCGITAAAEVDHALGRGLDVVVTDHHRPSDRLPACPVIHPALGGYPCRELCAAGVTHKLAQALRLAAGLPEGEEDLDLVALATVADLVPLAGENRRLVRAGLVELGRTRKPGLRALMRVAGVDPGAVTAHAVGHRLAPRMNAAGRLHRADAALELVLTEDEERAAEVAEELDCLNRDRQDAETRTLFAAEAARGEQAEAPAYVLAGEGWHPGVIGIVASRVVERHHRPCLLISVDDAGRGRGSGRSIPAYDLHAGLAACSSHLRRFGGHRVAAGFEIESAEIDAFRRSFVAHAASVLSPADLQPTQTVDAVVPGDALGLDLAEELGRLAPFGQGNPQPTLLVPAARVGDVRAMGEEGDHARFTVSSGGARGRAVAFRTAAGSLAAAAEAPHDLAVRLELNEWNGSVESRLVLRALCPTEPGACRVMGEDEPFWARVERELEADLEHRGGPSAEGAPPRWREVRDRRGSGFAGVAGDLLSSGDSVLVLCADVPRRRASLERTLGGGSRLSLASWEAFVTNPALAAEFDHLVALDPPLSAAGEALLAAAPAAAAFSHLAWGRAEVEFALAVAEADLDLRAPLAEVYRALRDARSARGADLESLLRGAGTYPRSPEVCGRLVRVLLELGLVSYEGEGHESRSCRVVPGPRTALERSRAYRAYQDRLAGARRYLSDQLCGAPVRRERPAGAVRLGTGKT